MAPKAICPSCFTRIFIGEKPRLKQQIQCRECGLLLEIISINPPIVDWLFDNDSHFYDNIEFDAEEFTFERI